MFASSSVALADSVKDNTKPIGKGYELVIGEYAAGLQVRKAGATARLGEAFKFGVTTVDAKTGIVDINVQTFTCVGTAHYAYSYKQLDARLENTAAYRLHKKADYKTAALGFARATADDPTWRIPAYNLASAHTLLGDKEAAIKALAPWIASEPVATYVQISTDPELAPLLDRPEVLAIRPKAPGTVKLTTNGLDGVAYSPDRSLLAVTRKEGSWGSSAFKIVLELHDLDGKLVAETPVVQWSETSNDCTKSGCELVASARPVIAKRLVMLEAMLGELGFAPPKVAEAAKVEGARGDKRKAVIANAKLGVVGWNNTARALKQNTELGTAKILDRLDAATYVDDAKVIVLWSSSSGPEGCTDSDPTEVNVIRLKP